MDHSKMDHSKMDHSKIDHSKMDHSKMGHENIPMGMEGHDQAGKSNEIEEHLDSHRASVTDEFSHAFRFESEVFKNAEFPAVCF